VCAKGLILIVEAPSPALHHTTTALTFQPICLERWERGINFGEPLGCPTPSHLYFSHHTQYHAVIGRPGRSKAKIAGENFNMCGM